MAQIRIIALKSDDNICNLLTTIKVTNYDEKQENFKFVTEINCEYEKSVVIYEGYLCFEDLDIFQKNISNSKFAEIDGKKISYEIDPNFRTSFLLQREDFYADKYNQILSPFYSNCYLEENWNTNLDVKNLWLQFSKETSEKIKPYLDINLEYFIDKVGNVLKFIQVNEVDVSAIHQNDRLITLGFKINKNPSDYIYATNQYIATIQIQSSSDIILKKSFEVSERFVDFNLQDTDDNIQIEVFNLNNNKCVYKRNMKFLGIGTKVIHQIRKDIAVSPNIYNIEKTKSHAPFEIASLEKMRERWTQRIRRKDESEFVRFSDTETDKANDYLIKVLNDIAIYKGLEEEVPEYVYLADPYLFCNVSLDYYIKLLNKLNNIQFANTEFRFIGCQNSIPEYLINELQKTKHAYKNIKIKSVRKREIDANGNIIPPYQVNGKIEYKTKETFHDRFLATKHIEYGFTNSINNFKKGVTFFRSFDVYFDDAEELWNIPANSGDFIVEEI